MTANRTTGFDPSPKLVEQLILDFCSARLTLLEVAAKAGIGLSALIEWLSSPEIAARLHAIEAAMMQKARLNAAAALNTLAESGMLPPPKRKASPSRKRSSPSSPIGGGARASRAEGATSSLGNDPLPGGPTGSGSEPLPPPRGYSWSGFTFENVHLRRRV